MGIFLNSNVGVGAYAEAKAGRYFVDKTMFLTKLPSRFSTQQKYVCVTRPRRFGKTTNAQMMAAFFGKHPCPELFADLKIASHPYYEQHLNQHNVIFYTFNDPYKAANITQWLEIIDTEIRNDLQQAYPDCTFPDYYSTSQLFTAVTAKHPEEKFIFIFDEWDEVFSFKFVRNDPDASNEYQNWLRTLLKDKPYVEFAYLTGIRLLSYVSPGSGLNMFEDFTLLNDNEFQEDFGFTQQEVEQLHQKYLTLQPNPRIDLPSLEYWYDGYDTVDGIKLYNPRSVVLSLSRNTLASYWTTTSSFDQIFNQIKHNIPAVLDDIKNLIVGNEVKLGSFDYSVLTATPTTRDEILSAMATYGFVSITTDKIIRIPNHELMLEFVRMIRKQPSLEKLNQFVNQARQLVEHIKQQDETQVAEQLEVIHNWFSPQQHYNSEAEFASVIRLAFIGVLDDYDIKAEAEAGTGRADLVLLPTTNLAEDVIIIELKVDTSPTQALAQIKSRKYEQIATNPFGASKYTGRILGVGVSYNRNDPEKQHSCAIEILSPAQ